MPAPTTQFFYRPSALPATQPTVSKHISVVKSDYLCSIVVNVLMVLKF